MADRTHNLAGEKLLSFIERAERLNEEITALNSDKSELFKEAKGSGFDIKIMKDVIKSRKLDPSERQEQSELFDLYMRAISGLDISSNKGHAHTRTHGAETPKDEPDYDPETGEIFEPEETEQDLLNAKGDNTAAQAEDLENEPPSEDGQDPEEEQPSEPEEGIDLLDIPACTDRRDEAGEEVDFLND